MFSATIVNVSDSSTMRILYSTCASSWVLLCILKDTVPHIVEIIWLQKWHGTRASKLVEG